VEQDLRQGERESSRCQAEGKEQRLAKTWIPSCQGNEWKVVLEIVSILSDRDGYIVISLRRTFRNPQLEIFSLLPEVMG